MNTFRRFATCHQRIAEKRTYVFILVPFDFSKNGSAKKAEVATHLLDNCIDSGGARSATIAGLSAVDRTQIRASTERTDEEDLNDEPQLNFDLIWTWFLPNPLPPPKRGK